MVAHIQARLVPIAVPQSCSQYVSSNWKTLQVIMSSVAASKSFVGNLCGRSAACSLNQSRRVRKPWSVSMLVYMDTASAMTITAVGAVCPAPVTYA